MEEQGGFGKFQTLAFLVIILAMNSDGFCTYNLSYLLLYPHFSCQIQENGHWISIPEHSKQYHKKCNPDYFCENKDVKYQVDENSKFTLHNITY
jgi:hypothetical protein